MTTIKLAEKFPLVLSFDGKVLEAFQDISSNRIHVTWIESLQLQTDKKGKHTLDINTLGDSGLQGNEVDEEAVAKVNSLIAEVEKAKAAFKFD